MANLLPKDVVKWWEEHKKSDAIAKIESYSREGFKRAGFKV